MRLIPVLTLVGSLGLALVGCGGGSLSEKDACNQAMAAICNRTFVCPGAAGLSSLGYATEADCTAGLEASRCANYSCAAGETYHPDQAQACVDNLKQQACSDLGTMPAACDLACSASGATGGGGTGGGTGGGSGGTGGGSATQQLSAQDACKQAEAGRCNRTFACLGQTGLTALGGYTSVAACTSDEQAQNCSTPAQAGCSSGKTYHPDQGKACVDAVAAWSCTDLASDTMPAVCGLVCQ